MDQKGSNAEFLWRSYFKKEIDSKIFYTSNLNTRGITGKKLASSWQQLVRESLAWCRIQLKAHKDKSAQSSIKILRSEKHTEALRNILLFNRSRTKKLFNNQNYLSVAVPESEDNCTLSTHIESTHHWNKWR